MGYKVSQGNIFGRIGEALGNSLSETVPKEIERHRLASGLKDFEQSHESLTPMQQMARLLAIPGITPQGVQSMGELAKQGNTRAAYARSAQAQQAQQQQEPQASPDLQRQQFGQLMEQQAQAQQGQPGRAMQQQAQPAQQEPQQRGQLQQQQAPQQQMQPLQADEFGQPQIVPTNPLEERNLTPSPWTPEKRDARISKYINQGFPPEEAQKLAADDESRQMADAAAYKQRNEELKGIRTEAKTELDARIKQKLQKSGEGVYEDLSGKLINDLNRGMERDLRLNPKASVADVAEKWSNKALRIAKNKTKANKLIQTTGSENFIKGKSEINKLKEFGEIMREEGASDDFFNLLQSKGGTSPQGAAQFAYRPTEKVAKYISNFKGTPSISTGTGRFGVRSDRVNPMEDSRRAAIELQPLIKDGDSLLAIAREMSLHYPDFDQTEFFEQMSEDKDKISLNERQRDEIAEGAQDITPTWGDFFLTGFKTLIGK